MSGARIGAKRNAYRILVGEPERKKPWEDLYVGERLILKWIIDKEDGAL
jgi:hypothetical protein